MYIALLILLVLAGIMFIPVILELSYDEKLCIRIRLGIFKIFYKRIGDAQEVTTEADEKSVEENVEEYHGIKENINKYFYPTLQLIKLLFKSFEEFVIIKKVSVKYTFGFKDAAVTGIFSGVAYSVIHLFVSTIYSSFKVKEKEVEINPDFNTPRQELVVFIKFRIFLVHFIIILFRVLRLQFSENKQKNK